MSITNQNAAYRRGVILGLTLAEIMLLVIFVLLLTFMAILKNEKERYEKLAHVAKNPSLVKISQVLEKERQDPSIMEELVLAYEKLPEIVKMIKKEEVKNSDTESVSDVIVRGIEKLKLEKEIKKQSGESDAMTIEQQLQQAVSIQESLKSEILNLKGKNISLTKQIESNGKGLVYPPCWADSNGKAEYIYDIDLSNDGILIHDNQIPHRAAEQKKLPISKIKYDMVLSNSNFQRQVYPLLNWSKANKPECRFFVRIDDKTDNDQKRLYKGLLKVVEGSFYKYER
jgi:hypothetical protein